MSDSELTHLWEHDHPYYCNEGCWYTNDRDAHRMWPSWADFLDALGKADVDLNLVWRWDWTDADTPYEDGELPGYSTLKLFIMQQRKARPQSHEVQIKREDEPAVRLFLQKHWDKIQDLWAPFHAGTGAEAADIAAEMRRQRIAHLKAELAALEDTDGP